MFSDLPYSAYLAANAADVTMMGIPCRLACYWTSQLGKPEFNRFVF